MDSKNFEKFYQGSLIFLAVAVTMMFGYFVYKELFPEYKEYQNTYVSLEEFRSTLTGEPVPPFKMGIKQIVMPSENGGPEKIDRCTSCHVALDLPHFSPTKIAVDVNGNLEVNADGTYRQVPNENYIWDRLDERIQSLRAAGQESDAILLEGLKTMEVDGHTLDATNVLRMHPLIGSEERPFQYHPAEEYGCTICHNGNGRGLSFGTAHGPAVDQYYEAAHHGEQPVFIESDEKNDPKFAYLYNNKPGHDLLFQTVPIFIGAVMESSCIQCHDSSNEALDKITGQIETVIQHKGSMKQLLAEGVENDRTALEALASLEASLQQKGLNETVHELKAQMTNYELTQTELDQITGQYTYLNSIATELSGDARLKAVLAKIAQDRSRIEGKGPQALVGNSSLEAKEKALESSERALEKIDFAKQPLELLIKDPKLALEMETTIDPMIAQVTRGSRLYISNGCYACHTIAGTSRGTVGPELTTIGLYYPWYIKQAIVWPQATLPTTAMPNFRLDHEEVEDLMAYLLAQKGANEKEGSAQRERAIKEWQYGKPMPWEKPLSPQEIVELEPAMKIFASEGCAACHKLKGFTSSVGFTNEKGDQIGKQAEITRLENADWFQKMFPEFALGSTIALRIQDNAFEINEKIGEVSDPGVLDEIKEAHPKLLETFYSNFKHALRARDFEVQKALAEAKTPAEKEAILKEQEEYLTLVDRVLMVYIQQYGLGRDIAPRLHWSGVYRDSEWLMGHFRNPAAYIAKSIMPTLPFDSTKFYALTNMLHILGKRNRDAVHAIWQVRGFDPQLAYNIHCSSCHGQNLQGNGVISEMIYPIPKNLRNSTFLRNLTKERATDSILNGVSGTPMPPWGQVAPISQLGDDIPVLNASQVEKLVDWLYQPLTGSTVIKSDGDVEKWKYTPEDVVDELENEGNPLEGASPKDVPFEGTQIQAALWEDFTIEPAVFYHSDERWIVLVSDSVSEESAKQENVSKYFREVPLSNDNPDEVAYYIREEYYTEENLKAGQASFVENCAQCHGKEAGGTGLRATAMVDAKPRMLTNLPWLESRDDLRLLRSIKYGVPGTSMTPWGDKTNTLQRMQMVMFIRSLTTERHWRDALSALLFDTFETSTISIYRARAEGSRLIESLEKEIIAAIEERESFYEGIKEGKGAPANAGALYQRELDLMAALKDAKSIDALLATLVDLVTHEKQLFESVGLSMVNKNLTPIELNTFFSLISAHKGLFLYDNGKLSMTNLQEMDQRAKDLEKELMAMLDRNIDMAAKDKDLFLAQIKTPQRDENLKQALLRFNSLTDLKTMLISNLREADRVQEKQKKVFSEFESASSRSQGASLMSSPEEEPEESIEAA